VRPAQAYTETLQQVGANVVATGRGAIDLTGLTFAGSFGGVFPYIQPNRGFIMTGIDRGAHYEEAVSSQ